MKIKNNKKNGFSLLEVIVSLGLFTIILFVATSSFLVLLNSDKKSRAAHTAMDNLSLATEDMSRKIKTGFTYDCEATGLPGAPMRNDCSSGGSSLYFTDQNGVNTVYRLTSSGAPVGIERVSGGVATRVTAPEINISKLTFFVKGTGTTASGDTKQPYVTILMEGVAKTGSISSAFELQTTVTQRVYDIGV